jgi:aconitate hydratase
MGQAPASGRISLRTVPRNFPGRSGTKEDQVYLCSPETAAASALSGVITDPRTLEMAYPSFKYPSNIRINEHMLIEPEEETAKIELEKGPNIKPLPTFDALPDRLQAPVLLKVGDDISTDEIMPAGSRVLPFRSNIPEISKFVFQQIDTGYYERAIDHQEEGSFVAGGKNYGQGSSREHAALAPRYLGVRAIIAKGYARIHHQNLANFGILPLAFVDPDDLERIDQDDILVLENIRQTLENGDNLQVINRTKNENYQLTYHLTPRQVEAVLAGSLINLVKEEIRSGTE